MTSALWGSFVQAVFITVLVATMMLSVEYLSVLSRGTFQRFLMGSRWTQYLGAVLLGAIPGCLGPFTVVALYTHRVIPLGAVVGAMIATSGDEAFVMFGLFPGTALWLTLALVGIGIVVGPLVDLAYRDRWAAEPCADLVVHEEDACQCFPGRLILDQWRRANLPRIALTLSAVAFSAAVMTGLVGPAEWNWVRTTLLLLGMFGGFVVLTVPDHFLTEHLWRHVALKHVPRIFVWTFGVLACIAMADRLVDLTGLIQGNMWSVLVVAVLLGTIPESGPHLVFVTLFSGGAIPVSILVASSITQDGHGMLPLLAESKTDFLRVKAINVAVGLAVGAVLLLAGA